MGIGKWVASKGVWYLLAVVSAYSVAWFFDLVPQPVKDTLKWFNDNTTALLFTLCFLVGAFVFYKVTNRKKQGDAE